MKGIITLIALLLIVPDCLLAQTETIGEKEYICIKIIEKDVFDAAITSLDAIEFSGSTIAPGISLESLASHADDYGGVLLWLSHGTYDGSGNGFIAIEEYSSGPDAEDRAITLMNNNTYYSPGDLDARLIPETLTSWVCLTETGVANKFSGNNSIAAIAACYGARITNWGARISIGYYGVVDATTTAEPEMTALFANLCGENGTSNMTTASAIQGFQIASGYATALIPHITSISEPSEQLTDTLNTISWTFGTKMSSSGFPQVGGVGWRRDYSWSDDYNLTCDFYCGWVEGEVIVGLSKDIVTSSKDISLLNDEVHKYTCTLSGYPPAASVSAFIPYLDGSGVRIYSEFEMMRSTRCLWVCRDDGVLVGDTISFEMMQGMSFEVYDPSGCPENRYTLFEKEIDGDIFIRADEGVFVDKPKVPVKPLNNNVASIENDISSTGIVSDYKGALTDYLGIIIVPDGWIGRAEVLADFWGSQGKDVLVIPLSISGNTREEIRACIEDYYSQGVRYVLLGAGTHDEWFDDPSKWPDLPGDTDWYWWYNNYHASYSSSPERNIIPTWYYEDQEYDNMSYWTPYYTSDYGYCDGLAGLRLGRFPAYSEQEFSVIRDKTIEYAENSGSIPYANTVSLWAYCHNMDGNFGTTVEVLSDEMSELLPPEVTQYKLYDDNLVYSVRETAAINDWSSGRAYIFMRGTSSTRHKPIHFFDKSLGWDIADLDDNERFPLIIGSSCGIGALDMYIHPTYGTAAGQDWMTEDSDRGACLMVAPTRGTTFEGNRRLCKWIIHYSMIDKAMDAGTMFLLARTEELGGPEDFLVKSYNYYGDPMAPLPGQSIIVDAGDETPEYKNVLFQNFPNPFNPITTINYSIHAREFVSLRIFNVAGQLVCRLVDEYQLKGEYNITWDGKDDSGNSVSSGVYFYQLDMGTYSNSKKMILLK